MTDETSQIVRKNDKSSIESTICGVSVRGWIVSVIVGTMCFREGVVLPIYYVINGLPFEVIKEPFYSAILLSLGYYFGQKTPANKITHNI